MSSVKYNDGIENSVEQDQTAPKGKEQSDLVLHICFVSYVRICEVKM